MAIVTTTTLPTNLLEAVNLSLRYMKEVPIDDLALINTSFAAETAYATLMLETRKEQTRGWFFNRFQRTYTPTADEIVFATNVINVEIPREDVDPNEGVLFLRANKLYNGTKQSYTFTTPRDLIVTELVEFDEMPEPFKIYVGLKAASLAGVSVGEDVALSAFHQRAFQEAEIERMDMELSHSNVNFFSTIARPR